jgi:hypothetical protein
VSAPLPTPLAIAALALALACAAPSPPPLEEDERSRRSPPAAAAPSPDAPGPSATAPGAGDALRGVHGRVEKVSEEWYGLVPDGPAGTRYAPDRLPEELRQDGLRVVFSGVVGEIPPKARTWGRPLRLTAIARER